MINAKEVHRRMDQAEKKIPETATGKYRHKYHLMPPTGWLNDPNGLSYYGGNYHVFFQYAPEDARGGDKCWGHYQSPDLLNWEYTGIAIYPDTEYDRNGAYSGGALTDDGNLELFYTDMQRQIADMKADGAEAIVLYIHWGYEYFLTPNRNQTAVAEKMCELGVDVIIGGHPHKIQPLELITADNGNQAVCLYSMGNFLSNQVIESMYGGNRSNSRNFQDHVSCPIPDVSNRYNDDKWDQHVKDCNDNGHTEDGLLFQTTFTKYSDGVVRLTGVDVLPTWCYRYKDSASGSGFGYKVVPLDKSVENWGSAFGIPDIDLTYANRSYDRTMKLVGDGLAACREAIEKEGG